MRAIAFRDRLPPMPISRLHQADYKEVLVIGPSHFADYGAQAVNRAASFATPLGEVPVDTSLVQALNERVGVNLITADHEHSLEMQLPFLQRQTPALYLASHNDVSTRFIFSGCPSATNVRP